MNVRIVSPRVAGLLMCVVSVAAAPAAQTPRSAFVKAADGVEIHYLEAGRGPAILFVPGWMIAADIWEHQIRHFSAQHRVVAMDPRSQGKSTATGEGMHPNLRARDIARVIDQLQLAPVVLVGWSMAVTEIAAYVDQFGTAKLSAVVLVDGIAGGPFDPKTTPRMYEMAGTLLINRAAQTKAFVQSMFRTAQPPERLARLERGALQMPTASAVAVLVGALTTDNRPALARIDRPTLIVVAPGGLDAAYDDMRTRLPMARFERIDGAGHALFVDQPDRFNAALSSFLASTRQR
jgi:microsomal epoxide hydrolase